MASLREVVRSVSMAPVTNLVFLSATSGSRPLKTSGNRKEGAKRTKMAKEESGAANLRQGSLSRFPPLEGPRCGFLIGSTVSQTAK